MVVWLVFILRQKKRHSLMFAAEAAKNPIVEILIYLCIMYCYYDNECSRLLPLLFLSESAASPFRQICSINSFGAEPFLFCLIWALCPADENKIFQFQSSQSPLHLWFIHPLPCLFFPNARFFIFVSTSSFGQSFSFLLSFLLRLLLALLLTVLLILLFLLFIFFF